MGIFSVIGKVIGGVFGGGSNKGSNTSSGPSASDQLKIMREEARQRQLEFDRRQLAESAKQKQMMMMIGGVAGIAMLFMFMKKGK